MSTKPCCASCKQPKVQHTCGVCGVELCKKCTERLPKNPFPLMTKIADELKHRDYCVPCFNKHVYSAQVEYEQDVANARQVFIFNKSKSEETRLYNRSEKPIQVTDCPDHAETLMQLAYRTVKAGYNALVDVEITSKKVRDAGYQTATWQGRGIPTRVDADRLNAETYRGPFADIPTVG